MKHGRKITGGKYHRQRKARLYEKRGAEREVTLGEKRTKKIRTLGGHKKTVLLRENSANIIINGRAKKAEIKNIIETPQNPFLSRQNRLIKGAVIETSLGKARITNRPSKEGNINATLIKD